MIDIHIAKNEHEKALCYKIRYEVFTKGQGIAHELDDDGLNPESEHAIMYKDNEVVGCARIRYVQDYMKLERIAVLEKVRGQGLGKKLMEFLIKYSKTKNIKGIMMSAQQYLEKFYKEFGFITQGKPYIEVGVPHVKMYRPKA